MTTKVLRLGRITDPRALGNIDKIDLDGDELAVSGRISLGDDDTTGTDLELARWTIEQLRGYVDNSDEPWTTARFEKDPTLDGFYEVRTVSAAVEPGGLERGWHRYDLRLRRLPGGWSAPLIEEIVQAKVRTNAHAYSDSNTEAWVGVPGAIADYYIDGGDNFGYSRSSEDGTIGFARAISATSVDTRLQYTLTAAQWLIGAARIEAGTTLRPIVGRQFPPSLATAWRLSNANLRVTPDPTNSGRIQLSAWDGSAWDTPKSFRFTDANTNILNRINNVTIYRNSLEVVSVRLSLSATGAAVPTQRHFITLVLRRGSRYVEVVWDADDIPILNDVRPETGEASTNITGGLRATANDAAGNRFVIASPIAVSTNTGTGQVYPTAATAQWSFMLGLEVAGSGAAYPDRAADLVGQYMAGTNTRIVVSGR